MRTTTLARVTNERLLKHLATIGAVVIELKGENLKENAKTCNEKNAIKPVDCFRAIGHEIKVPPKDKKFWEERMKRRRERLNEDKKAAGEEVPEEDEKKEEDEPEKR